jgi:hypothetical protein
MRIEDCIVTVERRTAGGCIDLAFVFTRRFAGPVYRLMLVFAVPNCLLVYGLASSRTDMLIPTLLIFSLFSAFFSGALVAAIGPQVFGVPISVRNSLRGLGRHLGQFSILMLVCRALQLLTSFCVVIPSIFVTAWCGHLTETIVLERTPMSQVMPRLSWLSAAGGYARNLTRIFGLLIFWGLLSAGLLVLIDFLSSALFNSPIVFGKVVGFSPDRIEMLESLLLDDPLVQTTLTIALWLPYPVIRIAWFFCYLDQRIRNECWDLDLQLRVEALRLQEAPA